MVIIYFGSNFIIFIYFDMWVESKFISIFCVLFLILSNWINLISRLKKFWALNFFCINFFVDYMVGYF